MEPTDKLTIVLEAQQWNVLLAQLAEGPYRVVAPLLQAIQQQCSAQQAPSPALLPQRRNGEQRVETSDA